MAGTQVFTLTQTLPAGLTVSPSFVMPAGITQYLAQFTLSSTDLADSTKTISFELDHKVNGAFTPDSNFFWQGGTIVPKLGTFGQPSIASNDIVPGDTYQAQMTLSASMTITVTITAS